MPRVKTASEARRRRHTRVRKKVFGDSDRPRLAVFRSSTHIYAQIIDDSKGHTLLAVSTLDPEIKDERVGKPKSAQAELVGARVAKEAKDKGITSVVFDRGGYKYHGRVKALAEAARGGGLEF